MRLSRNDNILDLIQQRLMELQSECADVREGPQDRGQVPAESNYLLSLAISKVLIEGLPPTAVCPVTRDARLPNAPPSLALM